MNVTSANTGRHALFWQLAVAALAGTLMSIPLILNGTPDIEAYILSIFSTVAFVENLRAGIDPWFTPAYGFGIPLPTSTWFIRFPLAIPAAFGGTDWLYAALWIGGESLFGFYFLRLAFSLTRRRAVSVILLVTALLSFSNLGPTYVDDWTENYFGWALLPACFWYAGAALLAESGRARLQAGAACAFALGMFTGNAHHNEMVTLFSGGGAILLFLLPFRPLGVLTVGAAAAVAVAVGADVLVPAVRGMLAGDVNPLDGPIATIADAPTLRSYGSFLEPWLAYRSGGVDAATSSVYARVPFFGAVALVFAMAGAIRPFASRQPVGAIPNDLARAIAVGFVTYSALTLLPSWMVLNLPRMWTYRDGQTVFGLLCAAMAVAAIGPRFRWPLRGALALHLAQMALVAGPIVADVLTDDDGRLFAYARREHTLFDGLRAAGVDGNSRLMLAGDLETLVRGSLSEAGVTAATDFALEGIPLVNAWYRGANTPQLGEALVNARYGAYETIISWGWNLLYVDAAALDVLGITHVAALERDLPQVPVAEGLAAAGRFEAGGYAIQVLHNEDAWSRAVLLDGGAALEPPLRDGCGSRTLYCRDFSGFPAQLQARLDTDARGSSVRAILPPDHDGGTVLVTTAAGSSPVVEVDGEQRPVRLVMGTFAAVDVRPGDRSVELSVRPTGRIALTLAGTALLVMALIVALVPARSSGTSPSDPGAK